MISNKNYENKTQMVILNQNRFHFLTFQAQVQEKVNGREPLFCYYVDNEGDSYIVLCDKDLVLMEEGYKLGKNSMSLFVQSMRSFLIERGCKSYAIQVLKRYFSNFDRNSFKSDEFVNAISFVESVLTELRVSSIELKEIKDILFNGSKIDEREEESDSDDAFLNESIGSAFSALRIDEELELEKNFENNIPKLLCYSGFQENEVDSDESDIKNSLSNFLCEKIEKNTQMTAIEDEQISEKNTAEWIFCSNIELNDKPVCFGRTKSVCLNQLNSNYSQIKKKIKCKLLFPFGK